MPLGFDIGDTPKLTLYIRVDDVLTDASSVVLVVTKPDASTSTPSVAHPATGTYTSTFNVDQAGQWLYKWTATTPNTVEDGAFFVEPDTTARLYGTRNELKQRLSIPTSDTADDAMLDRVLETESREIDAWCKRYFYKATDTRAFTPTDSYCVNLGDWNDLVSVTTLKTDASGDGTYETTWTTADYQLLCWDDSPNANAGPEPRPYTKVRAVGGLLFPWPTIGRRVDLVQVVGSFGWPAVPSAVRDACLIMATELFALKDTKFGATGVADLGIIRVRDNPKVMRLLGPYAHATGFA